MGELYICADANFSVENNSYNEHVIKKWNSLIKDEDIVLVTGIFADNLDILKSIVP
jgi:predicted phosphohydrolase